MLVCCCIRIVLLQVIQSGILEGKGQPRFTTGKWNPHHGCSQFVTANDGHVRSWDLRVPSVQSAWTVENAHSQLVRWWHMHTYCFPVMFILMWWRSIYRSNYVTVLKYYVLNKQLL